MRRFKWTALGVLALAGALSGCENFLEGEGITTDPNRPTAGARNELFVAMQARQFSQQSGGLARTAGMWTQQLAGVGAQQINYARYDIGESEHSGYFSAVYIGGGLIDQKVIIADAEKKGDRVYAGIAKVWTALNIGTAASLWGDIPFSEAAGENAAPKLDEQAVVYAEVQKLLDGAIADLQSGQGFNPGKMDLVYGGSAAKWVQAANSLKARFYMHWAAAQSAGGKFATDANTACGGNCVQKANAAAKLGISSAAGDFRTAHSTKPGEESIWFQFERQRSRTVLAGAFLVELLKGRGDPRLTQYYANAPGTSTVVGAAAGEDNANVSGIGTARSSADFKHPVVTYAETQGILAETEYRLGNQAQAQVHLNNMLSTAGLPAVALSGQALLDEILTQHYIALFQNIEVYQFYRRTCSPAITPVAGKKVPGRLPYGAAERNANPNIPSPTDPAFQRNDNDPGTCTASRIGEA